MGGESKALANNERRKKINLNTIFMKVQRSQVHQNESISFQPMANPQKKIDTFSLELMKDKLLINSWNYLTFSQSVTLGYFISYHDCGFRRAGILRTILQNDKAEALFNFLMFLTISQPSFFFNTPNSHLKYNTQ